MFFGGAFWSHFSARDSRAFEELLKKEGVTLEEILDQEDVIQEMKNQNQTLLSLYPLHSLTPEHLCSLLDFLVLEPPQDCSSLRGYKCPFIACELLTCDVPVVTSTILGASEVIDKLFGLLESPKVNLTLAGYFEKVASLLVSKHADAILRYVFSEKRWDLKLLGHLYSQSLSEFLIRLVLAESANFLDERREILRMLLCALNSEEDDIPRSAANCLCDVAFTGHSSMYWKDLALVLFTPENFSNLFSLLGSSRPASSKAAGRVLVQLISNQFFRVAVCRPATSEKPQQEDETVTGSEEEDSSLGEFVTAVMSGCELLSRSLSPSESEMQCCSFGEGTAETLGPQRLISVEVTLALTRVDIQPITLQLGKSGVFGKITEMFFRYHWNSLMHGYYYQLCTIILNSPVWEVRATLTLDTDLVEKISKFEVYIDSASGQRLRKGQHGFITLIAQMLLKVSETHADVEEVLSRADGWASYVQSKLLPTLAIENKRGPDSRVQTHQTEEDEDFELQLGGQNKEEKPFEFFFKGEGQNVEPQIGDDFEEGIPVGEDLNVEDLDSDPMFDLSDKATPFQSTFKSNEAAAMVLSPEQAAEAIAQGQPSDELFDSGRDFNSREYWRVPLIPEDLPDLE